MESPFQMTEKKLRHSAAEWHPFSSRLQVGTADCACLAPLPRCLQAPPTKVRRELFFLSFKPIDLPFHFISASGTPVHTLSGGRILVFITDSSPFCLSLRPVLSISKTNLKFAHFSSSLPSPSWFRSLC